MCDTRHVAVWRPTPLRPARRSEPPGRLRTRSTRDTKSHTSQNSRRSSSRLSRLYSATPCRQHTHTHTGEQHKPIRIKIMSRNNYLGPIFSELRFSQSSSFNAPCDIRKGNDKRQHFKLDADKVLKIMFNKDPKSCNSGFSPTSFRKRHLTRV